MKKLLFLLVASIFFVVGTVSAQVSGKVMFPSFVMESKTSVTWTPDVSNPSDSYRNYAGFSSSVMGQTKRLQITAGHKWSRSYIRSVERVYVCIACQSQASDSVHYKKIFRDTILEHLLENGVTNLRAVYLGQWWQRDKLQLRGGIGLDVTAYSRSDIIVNTQNPTAATKKVFIKPGLVTVLQLRKIYTKKKGEWNFFGESATTFSLADKRITVIPAMRIRATYNFGWIFGGIDMDMGGANQGRTSEISLVLGGFIGKHLNIGLSTDMNTLIRHMESKKGEGPRNVGLTARFGF